MANRAFVTEVGVPIHEPRHQSDTYFPGLIRSQLGVALPPPPHATLAQSFEPVAPPLQPQVPLYSSAPAPSPAPVPSPLALTAAPPVAAPPAAPSVPTAVPLQFQLQTDHEVGAMRAKVKKLRDAFNAQQDNMQQMYTTLSQVIAKQEQQWQTLQQMLEAVRAGGSSGRSHEVTVPIAQISGGTGLTTIYCVLVGLAVCIVFLLIAVVVLACMQSRQLTLRKVAVPVKSSSSSSRRRR